MTNDQSIKQEEVVSNLVLVDGKTYITSTGEEVTVRLAFPDSDDYPFVGTTNLRRYTSDGCCYISFKDEQPGFLYNLVSEASSSKAVADKHTHHAHESEAMSRFFSGELPLFSTGEDELTIAGYGGLSSTGQWQYPLPAPAEQWLPPKSRKADVSVKINGLKFKARIVPYNSNEIIKRNYVFCSCWMYDCNDEEAYNRYFKLIKSRELVPKFLITMAVGENVQEHKDRFYLEILSESYFSPGLTNKEFENTPADQLP